MSDTVRRWWPLIGWASVLLAYPLRMFAVVSVGAMIATIGHTLNIQQKLRPVEPRDLGSAR